MVQQYLTWLREWDLPDYCRHGLGVADCDLRVSWRKSTKALAMPKPVPFRLTAYTKTATFNGESRLIDNESQKVQTHISHNRNKKRIGYYLSVLCLVAHNLSNLNKLCFNIFSNTTYCAFKQKGSIF